MTSIRLMSLALGAVILCPGVLTAGDDGLRYPEHVRTEQQRAAWRTGWPCWRGPYGCGAAIDCGYELVRDAADARKLWESQDDLPTPYKPLRSGFASPVVAGGRVFLYYYVGNNRVVDEGLKDKRARLIARFGDAPFLRGVDSVTADDVVHCFDALTGKTLWRKVVGESIPVYGSGKTGGHFTMCVRGNRAVALGTTGRIYCLNVADGTTVWTADVGPMHEALQQALDRAIAAKHSMSQSRFCEVHTFNAAPQIAAGHVIQRAGNTIMAFDLEAGKLRWKTAVDGAGTRDSSSPIVWRAPSGKEYILHEGGSVYCIDASDGSIAWKIPVGGKGGTISAFGQHLIYTSMWDPKGKPPEGKTSGQQQGKMRCITAFAISPDGFKHLWSIPSSHATWGVKHFQSWSIYQGRAFVSGGNVKIEGDNGLTGYSRLMVDLHTGKILKKFAAANSDDAYAYGPVVVDGRYILQGGEIMGTDPAAAFFSDDGEPENKWPNAPCVSAAHVCGLHFIRGHNKLYCYDLRAVPTKAAQEPRNRMVPKG